MSPAFMNPKPLNLMSKLWLESGTHNRRISDERYTRQQKRLTVVLVITLALALAYAWFAPTP